MDSSLNYLYHLCGSCWYLWPGGIHKNKKGKSRKKDSGDKMEFGIIPALRSHEVSDLLLNSFFLNEPLGLALGLPPEQAMRWLPEYISRAVSDSVSICAIDPETDKIIGASVNILKYPGKDPSPSMMTYLSDAEPIMKRVARFLEFLHGDISLESNFGVSKIFMTLFLNVESHYAGRGIAMELAKRSEKLATDMGFELFQVDVTSEFSYKVYKKMDLEIVKEVDISEFKNFGENVELSPEQLGIHRFARVLAKKLNQ